ncbi:MAG TPA: hypothetical protein VHX49_03670 [Candidatus Acidoferrales bacterium]|jgi:hypothetical protein|nr:hypothetical protein [Candidatus Acidoferrales bacterium]
MAATAQQITLQHINVKLFLEDPASVDLDPLIPIFHSWITGRAFEEMLLDIADYRHVPSGPGVVLIGFQADYAVDNAGNRLGVRYNRKTAVDGDNRDALQQAARAALTVCQRLEEEPRMGGKLRFDGQEIEIFVNDRLLAPNRAETFEAARPDLDAFARKLFAGEKYSLSYDSGRAPRSLFSVTLKSQRPFSTSELLKTIEP